MAKQSGIHGLRGKVNGMSYYSSKNGGMLVRKINEGLGDRVKSSREYLNTRKNNAEFGACGDFAGAFIGAITSKWRFILISIATGMMVKAAKAAIVLDATSPWGQREIPATEFAALQLAFNGLSKNIMPECIASGVQTAVKYKTTTQQTSIVADVPIDQELHEQLVAIGANGFLLDLYHFDIDMPIFDENTKQYTRSVGNLVRLSGLSQDIGNIEQGSTLLSNGDVANSEGYTNVQNTKMNMLFVLFRPYRTIGNEKSVLQQHCAGWVYVPETVSA